VDGIGVWLIDESGRHLDVAARLRRVEEPPDTTLRLSLDDPIAQLALGHDEPVRVIDPRAHGEALRRRADRLGIGEVALAPLRTGERRLGVLVAGVALGRCFEAESLRLLQRLAEEITQVALHTRELQERAREAGLRDAERRTLRALVEAAPVGIFVIDHEGHLRTISASGAEQLGIDPQAWIGRPARALLDHIAPRLAPGEARRLQARLAWDPGNLQGLELRFVQPEERVLELGVRTVRGEDRKRRGQLWVSRDVTEERRLAGRLGWVRRLERLGALTGGVAHELHEQADAMRTAARQLLDAARPAPPPALTDLARAAERSAERARQLLELARPARPTLAPVDVEALLRELLERLRATRAPSLRIELALATALRPAHADREQLKRILETLAGHACDAAGRRGAVMLAARNAEPMPGEPPRLVIEVRDSGGALDQILDPSLATRPDVKGPGLELAVAVSLAEAQGATVEVESLPGRGSVFRLRWPAATVRSQAARRHAPPAARAQATQAGDAGTVQADESPEPREVAGALILLAEDEPAVRRLARLALERAGYRVAEAEDGEAAVVLFERLRAEVALAVVDLSMPRRDGIAALHAMRTLAPDLPAVVMTGGSGPGPDDAWPADARVLTKPFAPDELAEVVRSRLAARTPDEAPGPETPTRAG
jgi:two-component system cell cycle sensor histidine kinase/response regulator CckA